MNSVPCPPPAVLRDLVLGRLPARESAGLEAHLAGCRECLRVLEQQPDLGDALTALLPRLRRDEGPPLLPGPQEMPLVERLIECVRELGSEPAAADSVADVGDTPTGGGPPPGRAGESGRKRADGSTDSPLQPGGEASRGSAGSPFLAPRAGAEEIRPLGAYRILRLLGAGGMGLVFEAEDVVLNRRVAVKVIRPALAEDAGYRERFLREARAAAALDHDHVVPVYHAGEAQGMLFLAMPRLAGETLHDRIHREGKLPVSEACEIARQVALGLAAAHARGLIHRDLKPSNIWLDAVDGAEGGRPAVRARVLDFGMVHVAAEVSDLTESGAVVGTPAYMAPEQVSGGRVDPRTDLFSLGVVLYHALTGNKPFTGANVFGVLRAIESSTPCAPTAMDAAVPPAVSDLVLALLAKRPDDRPGSAREVAEILGSLVRTPPAIPGTGRRGRRWLLLGALLLLASAAPALVSLRVDTGKGTLFGTGAPALPASPFTVTHTGDSGPGSLRQTILNANANPGLDTITFAIPEPFAADGAFTLALVSALPEITEAVIIDGATQPGYAVAPIVVLSGAGAGGGASGLVISAGDSTVRGLVINDFAQYGIVIQTGGGNVIEGNYIGGSSFGIEVASSGNLIGGSDPAARNIVSGNRAEGIVIRGGDNRVEGNRIGTDAAGTAALGNLHGIAVYGGADSEIIDNLISGNRSLGIFLRNTGTTNTLVEGNFIGTDVTGTEAVGNGTDGVQIFVDASSNVVRDNLISGNRRAGVVMASGVEGNRIEGNRIGTDKSGTAALGNSAAGVLLDGAPRNEIRNNVVSANASGIVLANSGSVENVVLGNFIGTDLGGSLPLGNLGEGVRVQGGSSSNTIRGNVIADNGGHGVEIRGSASGNNVIQGNRIGTNGEGTAALGNAGQGIAVSSANNVIGGPDAAARNVVAASRLNGIALGGAGAAGNRVQGNYFGTDVTGTIGLGNAQDGVHLLNAPGNVIRDNLISGNVRRGVWIDGGAASGNVVQGNSIGTDSAGENALGNGRTGVWISGGAHSNRIGTDADGVDDEAERNVISGNGMHGVVIIGAGTRDNRVAGNAIGTNPQGTAPLANGSHGVSLSGGAHSNLIGVDADAVNPGAGRNIISGNGSHAVVITGPGTDANVIAGNFIGTDATGTAKLGNGSESWHAGVFIDAGASRNLVGGIGANAGERTRNLISGNWRGVTIQGAGTNANIVTGNFIGTDVTGAAPLRNDTAGVLIAGGARFNRIGADGDGMAVEAERNVIYGNAAQAIRVTGLDTAENVIGGNLIGTDMTGEEELGNGDPASSEAQSGDRPPPGR